MIKDIAILARKILGLIPRPVKSDAVAKGSLMLRRFCGALTLSLGDGSLYSLNASV